jgi:uncharacterized membrane protein
MEQKYNVVFSGSLKAGVDPHIVAEQFSLRFNYDPIKAQEILANGEPVVLKRAVNLETAEKFQALLEDIGMAVVLQPASNTGFELSLEPLAASTSTHEAAGGEQKAAHASYADASLRAETSAETDRTAKPVGVDAGRGISWLTEAFNNHVKKDLGAWIGAFVIYMVLYIVVSLVPFLGGLVVAVTAPVVTAGFIFGAHRQTQGESFSVGDIFAGFSQNTGQLMMVGVLYLVGMIVLGILAAVMVGGSFLMAGLAGGDPNALVANMGSMVLPILFVALLAIPLMMAYWFAAPLVMLNGLSAVEAMKLSFSGCLKNLLPLLVFSIVAGILLFLAMLPLFLGLLIMGPVLMASMYVAYQDIFQNRA